MNERPSFLFDTASLGAADRFEAYRALYASGSDVSLGGPDFQARVEGQKLGRLVLFDRHLNDVVHERSPGRVRSDGFEHFTLQLNLAGRLLAEVPEGAREVAPGEIIVFDMNRPQRTRADHAHILTFSVGRELVEAASLRAFTLHGSVLSAARGGVLADLMMSFVRRRIGDGPENAAPATRMFREALAMALATDGAANPRQDSADMLVRVRLLIESSLARRDLSPDWIAQRAGLSRTRLYELFQPLGGISSYVQKRRAIRLRALLGRPETRTQSVAQLAFQAGFAAESHATRLYKKLFGEPPGQHRRRLEQGDAVRPTTEGPGFDNWIRELNL